MHAGKISTTRVVIVTQPASYDRATAVQGPEYIVVKSFVGGQRTRCVVVGEEVQISSEQALEGARYGWYECRVPIASVGAGTNHVYKEDSTAFGLAVGAAGLLTLFAMAYGE